MRIMLAAGEASGDMYGAHLARALAAKDPTVRLFGVGGPLMRRAGVRLLYDPTGISTIGFAEAVSSMAVLKRVLSRLRGVLDRRRPDALVLIDFPSFNMRLARSARDRGIPVVYYFSPSAWAWRRKRARIVAAQGAKVCAVLPFERDVYRDAGADVTYVGHPLIDIARASADREALRAEWGISDDDVVIALLPGSRRQEIKSHLHPMMDTARRFAAAHPGAKFLLAVAHTVIEDWLPPMPPDLPIITVPGRAFDALEAADGALCKMGTVTLEAAILGCPIVAMYRTSASTYWIARRLYKGRYVALPNIIADKEIVPELFQKHASAENMSAALARILDEDRAAQIRTDYDLVKKILGGSGAGERAAATVLDVARSERSSHSRG